MKESTKTSAPRLNERLSAFLDGEATSAEAREMLDQLCRDPQLRTTLDRHQRMRAALRGELHAGLDEGFAGRVMAAIESESRPRERAWLATLRHNRPVRVVAGLAMAASLAAVTVLSVRTLLPMSDTAFPALVARPAAQHAAAATEVAASEPSTQWSELSPDAMAELDSYLMSHNNSAVDHGLSGSLGFMRVAAHEGAEFAE